MKVFRRSAASEKPLPSCFILEMSRRGKVKRPDERVLQRGALPPGAGRIEPCLEEAHGAIINQRVLGMPPSSGNLNCARGVRPAINRRAETDSNQLC
ncbi:MAG TPA: hypothetical protein VF600_18440 [Abditibacteriaceae bacterium]